MSKSLERLRRVGLTVLMVFAMASVSPLEGQDTIPVLRLIRELDPHDPVLHPTFDPIRPYFDWSMKSRFGYNYSPCYIHPESGPPCPPYPWLVAFDATGTSGRNPPFTFDWVIAGDVQCASGVGSRIDHTATLLPNGKVLIAGGRGQNNILLSGALLYDPVAGSFAATGSMARGRRGHTATLLPNGKVLIVGGSGLPTAELYDPSTGAFSPIVSPLSTSRDYHAATLLADGKVLIVGGRGPGGTPLATAELYDPATNAFSPVTSSMGIARTGLAATLLSSGRVLITGGGGANVAELFNPTAKTFSPTTGNMGNPLSFSTATLLQDGRVLITGGLPASAPYLTSGQLYDPATDTFRQTTGRMTARLGHTATRLQNGQVLIAGGLSGTTTLTTAELYDPVTDTFSPAAGSMSIERQYHSATLLPTGRVLMAGGVSRTDYGFTAVSYDPTTRTFGSAESASIALALPDADPFVDPPAMPCSFARQDTYPVTLRVKDGTGILTSFRREVTVKDWLIVSIGNSIASGEGNPDRPRQWVTCYTPSDCVSKLQDNGASQWQIDKKVCVSNFCSVPAQWQDLQCDRSSRAGPALAAWAIEHLDPHTSVTFLHLACSGAGIRGYKTGLLEPYRGPHPIPLLCPGDPVGGICLQRIDLTSNPPALNECRYVHIAAVRRACNQLLSPQVDQVARYLCPETLGSDSLGRITKTCSPGTARRIDALLVSVGANDVGFSDIVKACGVFQNCHILHSNYAIDQLNDLIRPVEQLDNRLAELPQKYRDLKQSIDDKLDVSKVYITQYPDPTHDAHGYLCDPALRNFREYAHKVEIKGWLDEGLNDIVEALDPTVDFEGITREELSWARGHLLTPLDGHLRQAATLHGWIYIHGLSDALTAWPPGPNDFYYHGVCAGEQKWVVGLQASYDNQGDLNGTLHPNFLGHTAYQSVIMEALLAQDATLAPVRRAVDVVGLKPLLAHPTLAFRGVSVGNANRRPVAKAGPDHPVRLGSFVVLDGTGSSDPDAGPSPLSFSWVQTGGPTGVLDPEGTTSPTVRFSPHVEGDYTFSLVVNDGQENSTPDPVAIKVPVLGDIDVDGDVDRNDLKRLRAAINKSVGPNDLRDVNEDGKIDTSDADLLATMCTRPKCATK